MRVRALLTGNRRDIDTTNPKALFTNIEIDGYDRDHSWVVLNDEIEKIQPKGHHKPILVEFDCNLGEYFKRASNKQVAITNVTNIKRVKKGK